MMLFKLSLQNLKKSMRDYAVYFATLVIGVAIFYVFNSLEKQTVMMNVSSTSYDIIDLMNRTMSAISVFVAFILGFLVVYASNFLIKRRKKEFGIYMLLGMEKRKIAGILVIETIIIGIVSLGIGVTVGIMASQGMSALVANLFEAEMTEYRFLVSRDAIAKTVIYFVIMYLVVLVLDTFMVGKAKLIDLINAGKKTERNTARNPVICAIVFAASCVMLGSAYYAVTAGINDIQEETQLILQIVKGAAATFLIFWSLSGLLFFLTSKRKKFYLKGLNSFTVKELGSRINTTIFSGSIICLMLFITICVLSSAMSIRKSINNNLKEMTPVDVNFHIDASTGKTISGVFEITGVNTSIFTDVADITSYTAADGSLTMAKTLGEEVNHMNLNEDFIKELREWEEEVIRVSEYNQVAALYGLQEYHLNEDEYIIVANYDSYVNMRNEGLEQGNIIEIGGKEYHPKYEKCQDGYIEMSSNNINFGFILVPDDVDLSGMRTFTNYYVANYKETDQMDISGIENYIDSTEFDEKLNPEDKAWPNISVNSRTQIYDNSIGLTAMIVFIGIYLGIVFMISSAAVLALKELSEASDNKEKYNILRKIGVDEKQINHSLFAQSAVFFGMPLLLACIHSVFGIQVCNYIFETFGNSGLMYSIVMTAGMIILIYGTYFMITYSCSKKIISDRR